MLTVRDVMNRFGVTQATVLGWIAGGELKAINVGRKLGAKKPRWRVTQAAVEAFEALRSATPAPDPTTSWTRRPAARDATDPVA
jgi:hypothetical protein